MTRAEILEARRPVFEAWAVSNSISVTRTPQALAFANGQRRHAGDYIMVESLCSWSSWNCALDSVVIELPTGPSACDVPSTAVCCAIEECRIAIEAAGLAVAATLEVSR